MRPKPLVSLNRFAFISSLVALVLSQFLPIGTSDEVNLLITLLDETVICLFVEMCRRCFYATQDAVFEWISSTCSCSRILVLTEVLNLCRNWILIGSSHPPLNYLSVLLIHVRHMSSLTPLYASCRYIIDRHSQQVRDDLLQIISSYGVWVHSPNRCVFSLLFHS